MLLEVSVCREILISQILTEPVDGVDGTLNDGQEGVDNPVLR